MTSNDLKRLKAKLPPDWAEKIAASSGFSADMVRKVLRNDRKNPKVIDAAIQIATEYQEELRIKAEIIKSI